MHYQSKFRMVAFRTERLMASKLGRSSYEDVIHRVCDRKARKGRRGRGETVSDLIFAYMELGVPEAQD